MDVRDLYRSGDDVEIDKEMRDSLYFNNSMFVFNARRGLEHFLKENK